MFYANLAIKNTTFNYLIKESSTMPLMNEMISENPDIGCIEIRKMRKKLD